MSKTKISSGVVHSLPIDLRKPLLADPKAYATWEKITPLARNEWIAAPAAGRVVRIGKILCSRSETKCKPVD